MDIQRKTPASRLDPGKIQILKEARRMCVNYALYCITMPDMFGYVQHSAWLKVSTNFQPEETSLRL